MKWMLKVKETAGSFYERYDHYLEALFRFLLALTVFMALMMNTGYNAAVTNPYVAVLCAFICAFLPPSAISLVASMLMILELYAVSLEVTVIAAILLMVMLLTYFVFKPGSSVLFPLSCTACLMGVFPALLPIALIISPVKIVTVVFGIVIYGLIVVVKKDVMALSAVGSGTMGSRVNLLLNDLFSNEKLILLLLSVTLAMLIISMIRHLKINYAGLIAIIAGNVVFILVYLFGSYLINAQISVLRFVIGMFVNVLCAAFIIIFIIGADYRHTETVQFEDEEYYYFVKAIPKARITPDERRVENITQDSEISVIDDFDIEDREIFVRKEESIQEEKT